MICRLWQYFEDSLALLIVILIAFFPVIEVIARRFFHTGVKYSGDYQSHLVFLLTFIAAAITARRNEHLRFSLVIKLNPKVDKLISTTRTVLSAGFCIAFSVNAFSFLLNAFPSGYNVGLIPIRFFIAGMVLGYLLVAFHFIRLEKSPLLLIILSSLLIALVLALSPLTSIAGYFFKSANFSFLLNLAAKLAGIIVWPLILLLILLFFFGLPIFVVLGGIGYLLFYLQQQPLEIIANEAYTLLNSTSIAAIPLFTVIGFLLSESKAGERMIEFFKAFLSFIPGGLAVMAIFISAFFTTFTGASGVTILALGGLLSYILLNAGYEKRFVSGLLTASGSIGLLFPPSLPVIIYGVTAQVSIKDMFIGGFLPGICLLMTMMLIAIFYALRKGVPREKFDLKKALFGLKLSFWELLIPLIIVISYFRGVASLVESAAIGLIYTLFVELVIHHDLQWKKMPQIIEKAMTIIGGVLFILALAKGLAYYIVDLEVPTQLVNWVSTHISSPYIFLILLNLALIITGCFMDIYSAIMVVVPLIIPLGVAFNIHPVHLGIIFLANLELGYLTPPVGLNLYLAAYCFNEPINRVYRDVLIFLFFQLLAVLLITYVPLFTTIFLK